MQGRCIPSVFVQSAAGGNERQAEYLWNHPLWSIGYLVPSALWEVGGPLMKTSARQTIVRSLLAERSKPSRVDDSHEPLRDLHVTQPEQFQASETERKRHARTLPSYRKR